MLFRCEWSASSPGCSAAGERATRTQSTGMWMHTSAGLDVLFSRDSNPDISGAQPLSSPIVTELFLTLIWPKHIKKNCTIIYRPLFIVWRLKDNNVRTSNCSVCAASSYFIALHFRVLIQVKSNKNNIDIFRFLYVFLYKARIWKMEYFNHQQIGL